MNPTQSMGQDIELPGLIAYDCQIGRSPMIDNCSEQRPFSSNANMARIADGQFMQRRLPSHP